MHILDVKREMRITLETRTLSTFSKFEFPKDNMEFAYFNGMFVNGDGAGGSGNMIRRQGFILFVLPEICRFIR